MRRSLNLRVFLILLLVIGLIGAGIYFFHNWQVKNQIQFYQEKAEQAVAEKEPKKAIEYLERYILLQPNDFQAYNRYAMLVDDSASNPAEKDRAYRYLEKAIRQYTSKKSGAQEQAPSELSRRAGMRAFELGRYRDALVLLEPLEKASPQDIELKIKVAECQVGLTQTAEAEKKYIEIIKMAPSHIKSYKDLARLYVLKKDTKQAEDLLRKMVSENKDSIEARLALILFLREQGRLKDAEIENEQAKVLMAASKVDSADKARADLLLGSAEIALARRKPDNKEEAQKLLGEAGQLYTQGMAQFPKDIRFILGKAAIELERGAAGRPAAVELLNKAIPLVTTDGNEQWQLVKLLIDTGEKPQAVKLIEGLRAKYGTSAILDYFRARMLFDEGKFGEYASIVEQIKDGLARIPPLAVEADFLLSEAYKQLDNPDRRLVAIERIIKVDSTKSAAQIAKADALVAMGRIDDALGIYRKQLAKNPSVCLPLMRLVLLTEMRKPHEQRDWSELNRLISQCPPEDKKTKDYNLIMFQLLAATNKFDELEKAVNQACIDSPKEVAYWLAKMSVAGQIAGQDEKARTTAIEKVIAEAERAVGDRFEFRLTKAILSINANKDKALPGLEALERNTEKLTPNDQLSLAMGLGNIYFSSGFYKEAKRVLGRALELDPANANALLMLVDIAIGEKDDIEAQRIVKILKEKEGEEGYRWRWASLNRLLSKMDQGERNLAVDARKLLDDLSKLRPSWSQLAIAQGRLLDTTGQLDLAADQYKKAIELGERNPDLIKRAVKLLTLRRRLDDANAVLKLVMEKDNISRDYTKLLTEVSMRSTKDTPEQTLEIAKNSVPADSKDYKDWLWLGNVHWAAGDIAGAESSFKRALALGKDDPETWSTWICYLIKVNRKNEAAAEVKAAETLLKDKAPYVLASYYMALNQYDKAEEQFVKLANSNPSDHTLTRALVMFHFQNGDFEKAAIILKKLIDSSLIDATTLAWAQRNYALTLALKGDYPSYQQAMQLIEQNLKNNSTSPEDIRTRALILASRPGATEAVIKDLETSYATLKPNAGESILLSQLYEELGNWEKALSILDRMLREDKEGQSPKYLAYYIQALIRNNQIEPAARWMKTLETKAPNDPALVEPKAKLLFASGDKKAAVDYLLAQAEKSFVETNDPTVYFRTSALLEDNKEYQPAEIMIRKFASQASSKSPRANLALVAFLSRRGRVPEALALCEELWSKLPVGEVSRAMVAALHTGKSSKEDIQRVEKRLQEAYNVQKQDLGLAIALADLFILQKRDADSEAVYRRILDSDGNQPVALNNLAWLLSERPGTGEEALKLINKAIDRYGPDGSLMDTRGMIYLRNGKVDEAIKDLSDVVKKSPASAHWLHLAYAQHHARNTTEAERIWKKLLAMKLDEEQLSPSDRTCYSVLATAYKR